MQLHASVDDFELLLYATVALFKGQLGALDYLPSLLRYSISLSQIKVAKEHIGWLRSWA